MFARYGYVFDDDSNLAKFFDSKEWYSSNSNYSGDLHSEIEEDNCKLIRIVEFTKLSHDSCPDITSDYVFPNSSSSLLSSGIEGINKEFPWFNVGFVDRRNIINLHNYKI